MPYILTRLLCLAAAPDVHTQDAQALNSAPQSQYNCTGPESHIMPTIQYRFQPCCNAQIVVDADSQLIRPATVRNQASDQGQLPRQLEEVQESLRPLSYHGAGGYRLTQ